MITVDQLLGSWELVRIEQRSPDGTVRHQEDEPGQILYSPDGRMSAQLMSFGSFASYFGTYSVDSVQDLVVHHVLGGQTAEWIGQDWPRHVAFTAEGELVLTALNPETGREADLVWRRVAAH